MVGPLPLIAVVDDDAATLKALSRLLRVSEFTVTSFSTGRAFLGSLRERMPDCLVVDLQMPDLNGLDILRALRAADHALPVIVITAHDEPGLRAGCTAAGALAYLPKPVDGTVLLEAIGAALHGTKVPLPNGPRN
jgi:FixJ family two-component response regulator